MIKEASDQTNAGYYFKTDNELYIVVYDKSIPLQEQMWETECAASRILETPLYDVYYAGKYYEWKTIKRLNDMGFIPNSDIYSADENVQLYHDGEATANEKDASLLFYSRQKAIFHAIADGGDSAYAFYKKMLKEDNELSEEERESIRNILLYFRKMRFKGLTKEEREKLIRDGGKKNRSFWDTYLSKEECDIYRSYAKRTGKKATIEGFLDYFTWY